MVVHGEKLRWLFWVRWKTFARSYTTGAGRGGRIAGLVFLLLFGIPFMGGIAIGTYFAYRLLPPPANGEVLFLVLTGIYILWIILPLLEFTMNEGLDVSKLALFPLTRAELMLSLVISSLIDIPTLGLLVALAAVVAGWAFSLPLALMTLLVMIVFYAQIIGISQLVLALLARTLQSRRFRDLSIILIAIFSSSCYLFQQFALRGIGTPGFFNTLKNGSISPYLQWLPSGMAARAVQQASMGNWGISFTWLIALLLVTVVVLYCWQMVVENGLSASESGSSGRTRKRRESRVIVSSVPRQRVSEAQTSRGMNILAQIRSSQAFAVAIKDIKYYRRDPQLLGLFVRSFFSMFVLIAVTLFNTGDSERTIFGPLTILISPLYALFALMIFSYNILGMERQSLTTLFLFPIHPKQVMFGKNIITGILGGIEVVLLVTVSAFVLHAWNYFLPALILGLAGVGIIVGCGNFSSVYFPQRMPQGRRGFQNINSTNAEGGCLRSVMSLGVLAITILLLIPVAAMLVLPIFYHAQWVWVLTIPLSLVYGAALYVIITNLVAPRMLNRVPEILAVVARE
ncbi:MAG TPA: hypothetical protein DHW02_24790 [Ktedonobacter sp.]|nr:hypothetical protein [Ktedonobacter sp.]